MKIRKGQINITLSEKEFKQRMKEKFYDPQFNLVKKELEKIIDVAWSNYDEYHKSPRVQKAGKEFSDPDFELAIEWLETKRKLIRAEKKQKNPKSKSRILVICASPRNDQTCPGEMSKTFRLADLASKIISKEKNFECDFLDLSRLTAEYGKVIFPCKACVSTAMPLCNWPCSCYPNHALAQTNDWMAEIYEKWVLAHGVMIVTPVHWYQSPSVLKLMIDRLVCADGGNPDPTTTGGKDPVKAKKLELSGWSYPKHLAGRAFSIVVHGDSAGVENLKRILTDWLTDMHLIVAGPSSIVGQFIGYYRPYATSHDDLDKDKDIQLEVENAAKSLVNQIKIIRSGKFIKPDAGLEDPKQK
ncbi:MAG: NAD(P)H-dependent oxidoreductase [Bdellovibrio sp.]|nr:NAD(P)H-dependent oxidoreductase [Bdellovibrio sp.]